MVKIREYSVSEFGKYIEYHKNAKMKCIFLHHTYIPNRTTFNGISSMYAIRNAHLSRGGRDIFCHCYTTPQGTVFNGRYPTDSNCACQAPPEDFKIDSFPQELKRLILEDYPYSKFGTGSIWRKLARAWPNAHGFSIETVGNFDSEDPDTSIAMQTSIDIISIAMEVWNIPEDRIFFHRDVSSKTCPGSRVTKSWVKSKVKEVLNMPDVSDWAYLDVELAKSRGIMSGFPDGTFKGRENVTREQLAVVANRIIEYVTENINDK